MRNIFKFTRRYLGNETNPSIDLEVSYYSNLKKAYQRFVDVDGDNKLKTYSAYANDLARGSVALYVVNSTTLFIIQKYPVL